MGYIFLFILGLAFGSFLNVVSLRYKPEQKLFDLKIIGGRSHCPHCRKQLKWSELIPIFSFLFQKGKCRHCGAKLSFQYPLVEILAGLIFAAVPAQIFNFQFSIFNQFSIDNFQQQLSSFLFPLSSSVIWVVIFLLFLLLSIIDFRHYIIPDGINISLAILGIVLIFVSPQFSILNSQSSFLGHYSMMFGSFGGVWLNHFLAAILAMVFFGAIIVLSRGRGMGVGDFKLAGALGLIFGWPDILLVLALSFIFGAAVSLVLMARKKKTMKDAVPFGPFLVLGAAAVFFFGFQITDLYFKFFDLVI